MNLQTIGDLTATSGITSLSWSDEKQNDILIGRSDSIVRTFDTVANQFHEKDLESMNRKVVGIAYNEKVIVAYEEGEIHFLDDSGTKIETGDNISRMRSCLKSPNLIAVGGKERQNNLKVYDTNTQQQVFNSKNVPHDNLQLEVPVWDSDLCFITPDTLATCSRYGYIRYFDTKTQRRPVFEYKDDKDRAFNSMAEHNGIIYASTTTGGLFAFDTKMLKRPLHTYKGATGAIMSIAVDESGKYVFTTSLDRYVRVNAAEKTNLVYQCYVKSKGSQILVKTSEIKEETPNVENEASDEEYNELFDKMQTIEDQDEDEPSAKKPKTLGKTIMKRHCGLRVPSKLRRKS